MRACWNLEPLVAAGESPMDGPDGDPAEHDLFGNWSSSDGNAGSRLAASAAPPTPSPVRFGPGPRSGTAPQTARVPPHASGWESRVARVVGIDETGCSSALLDAWYREAKFRPTAAERRIISDPILMDGFGSAPLNQARSDSNFATRALILAGAKRVPSEEFWTLNDAGESVAALEGRDFAVWALPQRPVCAYHH